MLNNWTDGIVRRVREATPMPLRRLLPETRPADSCLTERAVAPDLPIVIDDAAAQEVPPAGDVPVNLSVPTKLGRVSLQTHVSRQTMNTAFTFGMGALVALIGAFFGVKLHDRNNFRL